MNAGMDEVEPPRRPAPRAEEPPKKKGLFQRILEADDEDEELEGDEGWTEEPEQKKAPKEKEKKPRKRLIEFIEADDDEDEEEDY